MTIVVTNLVHSNEVALCTKIHGYVYPPDWNRVNCNRPHYLWCFLRFGLPFFAKVLAFLRCHSGVNFREAWDSSMVALVHASHHLLSRVHKDKKVTHIDSPCSFLCDIVMKSLPPILSLQVFYEAIYTF